LALQQCSPGKLMADLQFPGTNGQPIALRDVCAKNKVTLLLFWRSNCKHCQELKPVLTQLYEKYHPQGLEIYALSLDKSEEIWKGTLQKEPVNWVNVFVPNDKRQEINLQAPIPSTPTLLSVNSERKVLQRLILRDQVELNILEALSRQ